MDAFKEDIESKLGVKITSNNDKLKEFIGSRGKDSIDYDKWMKRIGDNLKIHEQMTPITLMKAVDWEKDSGRGPKEFAALLDFLSKVGFMVRMQDKRMDLPVLYRLAKEHVVVQKQDARLIEQKTGDKPFMLEKKHMLFLQALDNFYQENKGKLKTGFRMTQEKATAIFKAYAGGNPSRTTVISYHDRLTRNGFMYKDWRLEYKLRGSWATLPK
jgi:hypothetical protein